MMKSYNQSKADLEHLEDPDWIFEMTGVSPRRTGLSHYIWISSKGNTKHSIRIKVSNVPGRFADYDNFSMSVHLGHDPRIVSGKSKLKKKDLNKIQDWIRMNYDELQTIWNSDTLDSGDHLGLIRKIS